MIFFFKISKDLVRRVKVNFALTLLALSYSFLCNAQVINGRVKAVESGELIAFVNIGVLGTNIGSISRLNGAFSLDLSEATSQDTLRFSFIGYESLNISVDEIRRNGFNGEVLLSENVFELAPVTVISDRLVSKMLGIPRKDCYPIPLFKKATSHIPFPQESYTHEIGTYFENEETLFLDSLEFNFTKIQRDNVSLRINIYVNEDGVLKNVLRKPLYIDFLSDDESQRLDLSDLEILVENDFLISIENYGRIEDNSLSILANFKSKGEKYPTYYKRNTQSDWVILKSKSKDFGMSFIAYVSQ